MKIGEEVYIHGFIDEIRKDTIIIRNEGGYFGTVKEDLRSCTESQTGKAEWIETSDSICYFLRCSACGTETRSCTKENCGYYIAKYCPNCGAKMKTLKDLVKMR